MVVPEFSARLGLSSEMLTPGPSVPAAQVVCSDSDVQGLQTFQDKDTEEKQYF